MSDVRLLQKSNIYIYESFSGLPRKIRSLYVQSVEHAAVNCFVMVAAAGGSNNTEIIHINNPPAGTYTIKVTLYTNSDQNVPYAIAWRLM